MTSSEIQSLVASRDMWRRLAYRLERAQGILRSPGDHDEIVVDDAGDVFIVTYGVHDFPIGVAIMRGPVDPRFREHARPIVGDVRMTKRLPRAES